MRKEFDLVWGLFPKEVLSRLRAGGGSYPSKEEREMIPDKGTA
jgi:hypothetical protein